MMHFNVHCYSTSYFTLIKSNKYLIYLFLFLCERDNETFWNFSIYSIALVEIISFVLYTLFFTLFWRFLIYTLL